MALLKEFGGVTLLYARCENCGEEGFVIDNQCGICFSPIKVEEIEVVKESIGGGAIRKTPNLPIKGNCTYCGLQLGTFALRKKGHRIEEIYLKPEWDHFVPHSYSLSNNTDYILSCHICNKLKRDLIFSSLDEAKRFLFNKRKEKGYTNTGTKTKSNSCEAKEDKDEEIWSVEFLHPTYWD